MWSKILLPLLMNQPECSESSFLVCFGVFAVAMVFVLKFKIL